MNFVVFRLAPIALMCTSHSAHSGTLVPTTHEICQEACSCKRQSTLPPTHSQPLPRQQHSVDKDCISSLNSVCSSGRRRPRILLAEWLKTIMPRIRPASPQSEAITAAQAGGLWTNCGGVIQEPLLDLISAHLAKVAHTVRECGHCCATVCWQILVFECFRKHSLGEAHLAKVAHTVQECGHRCATGLRCASAAAGSPDASAASAATARILSRRLLSVHRLRKHFVTGDIEELRQQDPEMASRSARRLLLCQVDAGLAVDIPTCIFCFHWHSSNLTGATTNNDAQCRTHLAKSARQASQSARASSGSPCRTSARPVATSSWNCSPSFMTSARMTEASSSSPAARW